MEASKYTSKHNHLTQLVSTNLLQRPTFFIISILWFSTALFMDTRSDPRTMQFNLACFQLLSPGGVTVVADAGTPVKVSSNLSTL